MHTIPEADGLRFTLGYAYRVELTAHARDVLIECFDMAAGGRVDWALVSADAGLVSAHIANMAAFHEETPARAGLTGTAAVERPDDRDVTTVVLACLLGRAFTTRPELAEEF